MASGEDQGSDVGEGDAGNQVVSFTPGAKTIWQGYHTWDHKRLSASPFNFSWDQPEEGKPAPPPINQNDPIFVNRKPSQGLPNGRKVFCRQDGLPSDCLECFRFSLENQKPGKGHNSKGVLIENGKPIPACPKIRFGPGRIKSNRDYLTGEDPEGWEDNWYRDMSDPAPSQKRQKRQKRQEKQKRQKRQEKQTTANDQALDASGDVLPTSAPAVEQPQQQASGLDALLQIMSESAQRPETQQLSNKSALFESVDNDQALEASHDENAEQLHASDNDSTASEMTKWARKNNVDDFEQALSEFETPAEPPNEPPTQPGIVPDPSANANFVNSFFV